MSRLSSFEAVEALYAERGGLTYGEGVSQLEHALQCAALAQADRAPPSLIIAALLHDVGHLLEAEDLAQAGVDDRHEGVGARALKGLFGEAVWKPIALHVSAKRYLCFKDMHYIQTLSPASQHSLALQGGPLNSVQAAIFERQAYWREAIALRQFDDIGKSDDSAGRAFADFMPMMRLLSEDD
jgi:phosphonate degradation associated HDIG domain protein